MSHLHVVATQPATSSDDAPLIERAVEIEVLGGAVRCLAEGDGGVVVLDAPAGLGKTALLEHAALTAADAGCLVRRAAPGPLERHFPFGVVRALLEAPLREASEDERAQLLDGAAAPAGTLLLEGTVPSGDSTMLVAHGVLWLCSALAEQRPLALVVDDAQWADRSSLEVLGYLARRIDDLPLLIAVGARVDDPRAPSDLLSLLGGVRSATVLHPQRLTPRGAAQLIRRLAPETSAAVCRDCHRAVGGNPWLLGELGRQIATHGPEAIDRAGDDAPPVSAIARNVIRWRLATLAPRDRAVAAALAVLGDGALPHVVATVAGVAVSELAPARDALLAAGPARSRRRAPGPRPGGRRGRGGPHRDRVRAHAPRGRARADGRPRGRRPRRQPPAPVPPAGRSGRQRAAGAGRGDRGAPRGAAHGGGLPRARAAASTRRATTAGACSRSWRRWPSTRACPTRSAACSMRCPRCAIARAASTCSRAWPRSTSSAPATPITPSCSSASWPARAIPTPGWRSRPRRSTR